MRIWTMSDLHIETARGWDLPSPSKRPTYDVFVCAGDLMPGFARGVKWLAERIDDHPVVVVAGNHEFFGRDIDREIEKAREAAFGTNVVVLDDEAKLIGGKGGVLIAGAVGWTDFDLYGTPEKSMLAAAASMNDYRRIRTDRYARRLRPRDTLARHRKTREFISSTFGGPKTSKRLLVTHHPFHAFGGRNRPASTTDEQDLLGPAYASRCPEMFAVGLDAAISGHTHVSFELAVEGVKLIANCKGYGPWDAVSRWENDDFDPCFTFDI
ncbi:metallophosphoesterase [Bradyrhizobium japonicum]|uniref:metallophosphoesterase n=1 Tax=Bradyrhizobium japonicum TaxID=375 RepID=UPI00040CDDC9|nr:metallophosphoesterase [Bradyrhizobium japonicum]